MLNRPWIDPRNVDWTQSPNPQANPGWSQNNNPYVFAAMQDPFLVALRNAQGVEPRIYVGPEQANLIIPAGQTQDYDVPCEPNFWIYALKASGTGADFLFNILDQQTGAQLASQPFSMRDLNNLTSGRGPQHFLSTPHLFASPSYPIIRIINNQTSPETCRVTLFGCVEYDV